MELRDQDFQVGDEVVYVERIAPRVGTVCKVHEGPSGYLVYVESLETIPVMVGKFDILFHRDAITIDEHGRLTAIDHDYVKPRAPKVVTKEPHEFTLFEKVLVRNFGNCSWQCDFFSFFGPEYDEEYPYICIGSNHSECIPFAGNEHLVGKVTE